VGFDAILNTVWLLLGTIALAVILARTIKGSSRLLCCIGVGLVVATLFPVISATDDVIRIQHLEGTHHSHKGRSETDSHKRTSDNLIRLYEAMESPLAATPVRISFSLFFIFLIVALCVLYARQRTVAPGGRSPPSCLA
jgi:hypothetical protein